MTKSKNINSTPRPKTEEKLAGSSKERRTPAGFLLEDVNDLKRQGIDTSDELVIHLGQEKKLPIPATLNILLTNTPKKAPSPIRPIPVFRFVSKAFHNLPRGPTRASYDGSLDREPLRSKSYPYRL